MSEIDIKDNQIELLKEDIECVHMKLDDIGAPRTEDDKALSINGRIEWLRLETLNVIKIAKSRKFTRNYTPDDDHLVWLSNCLTGNGPKRR